MKQKTGNCIFCATKTYLRISNKNTKQSETQEEHEIASIVNYTEEAPIYFSNIFFSLFGLAYFTPLGRPPRLNFFWQF